MDRLSVSEREKGKQMKEERERKRCRTEILGVIMTEW